MIKKPKQWNKKATDIKEDSHEREKKKSQTVKVKNKKGLTNKWEKDLNNAIPKTRMEKKE